jgi:prepilin-type N-terminal cleavage/methylation domain-containing protein
MKRSPNGFTLIELVIVILIGSILVGIALSSFQNAQSSYAARGAKTMYATLHQLARARSIEMGETMLLIVDSDGDSAYIEGSGGVSDITHFRRELNVDLRSTPSRFRICMTPRGYADPDCPALALTATTDAQITLEFWQNADSSTVIILPMGQLVGM